MASSLRDPEYDDALRQMNDALEGAQDALLREHAEAHPILFVVGPPRSGTTLALQLLSSNLDVAYVNNLTAAFWSAPLIGVRLSKKLLGDDYCSSYSSNFGQTQGAREPHEFGRFWIDLLAPYGLSEPDEHAGTRVDWKRLQLVLNNMSEAFGRTSVFKAPMLGWYVAEVQRWLPRACFVKTVRNPLDNALSILKYRRAMRGSEEEWVSLRPGNIEALSGLSVERQVAGQLYYLERSFQRQVEQVGGRNVLEVRYEDMCADPGRFLEDVRDLVSRVGSRVELRGEVPASFEVSRARRAEEPRYEAVAQAIDESSDGVTNG